MTIYAWLLRACLQPILSSLTLAAKFQEDAKLMKVARLVVDRIQKKWVIQAMHRWDKYVDDRAERRANGYESPPTDEECRGIAKKAPTTMQRSAGPRTTGPEALEQEHDKDKALEELGETMRVQQEEIIRLNNVAKDDNMRFVAKEYQWKEVKFRTVFESATAISILSFSNVA